MGASHVKGKCGDLAKGAGLFSLVGERPETTGTGRSLEEVPPAPRVLVTLVPDLLRMAV